MKSLENAALLALLFAPIVCVILYGWGTGDENFRHGAIIICGVAAFIGLFVLVCRLTRFE